MKRKGIAGAIGFNVNHPLRTSSRNALSVSSVTWFVIFCCGKLIASLQKNKPSPFVVKNTIWGIFHPHALGSVHVERKGEDSKGVKKWRNDMRNLVFVLGLVLSFNAYAANTCGDDLDNNCWDCGKTASDNCTARVNGSTLTIVGSGEMADYDWDDEHFTHTKAPWREYYQNVDTIDISGITYIGKRAFRNFENVSSLSVSDSVKTIDGAFIGFKNLRTVIIPEGVEEIKNGTFFDSGLSEIVLPNSLKIIGDDTFKDCDMLSSILIPDSVQSIGAKAFSGTSGYVYCQESENHGGKSCGELVGGSGLASGKLKVYTIENGKVKVGSKTYNSLSDLPQYVLKRIYTIDEANAVAGEKNRVSIRYR